MKLYQNVTKLTTFILLRTSWLASFLSLNLHALAEQLAKVDVSGRLFIEADLLATELGSNTSSSQEYDQLQTTGSEASSSHGPDRKPTTQTRATLTISEESAFEDFSEKNKAVSQNTKVFASGLTVGNTDPFSFIQGSDVKGNLNRNQCGKSNQSTTVQCEFLLSLRAGCPRLKQKLLSLTCICFLARLVRPSYLILIVLAWYFTHFRERCSCHLCQKLEEIPLVQQKTPTLLPPRTAYLMIYLRKHLIYKEKEDATPLPLLARNALASAKTTSTAATLDDVLDGNILDDLLRGNI
ncbi:hypothetical protein NC652_019771 [Populus alba x Populus x berolinensis]|nr:hypothetical protein NC652_019771 [Populus alba x Populus x berolinensis]